MAADFFGNCQICGREQKSHENAIAKHGYTIQHGWQSGQCYGSHKPPYQVSCDAIAGAIAGAKAFIESTNADIWKLAQSPLDENGYILAYVTVAKDRGISTKGWRKVAVELESRGAVLRGEPGYSGVRESLGTFSRTTKEELIAQLAKQRIAYLQHAIDQTEKDIPYMEKRVADWKPMPMRPVSDADRAAKQIKVHMAVRRWNQNTSICVASAQGASAYKQTTTDRALVTCAACLKELARQDDEPRLKTEKAAKELTANLKRAERDIKEYTKLVKNAVDPMDAIHYARGLNEATADLLKYRAEQEAAAAPGQ
jgi:hypothetical protein